MTDSILVKSKTHFKISKSLMKKVSNELIRKFKYFSWCYFSPRGNSSLRLFTDITMKSNKNLCRNQIPWGYLQTLTTSKNKKTKKKYIHKILILRWKKIVVMTSSNYCEQGKSTTSNDWKRLEKLLKFEFKAIT